MSRITSYFIIAGLVAAALSLANMTAILLQLPLWIGLLLSLVCAGGVGLSLLRNNTTPAAGIRSTLVASCTILIITFPCCRLITPHASYDGLSNWNLLAKYFSTPGGLNNVFKPGGPSHSDYPPGLPGMISFFWRAFGNTSEWFPFILSFAYLAGLSILIATELCRRHLVYGIVVLLVLATCPQYISQGLRQCADIPLAFYFVAALVALEAYKNTNSRFNLVCAIASIGAMPLIKNDGLLLSLSLLVFYARPLFRKANIILILATFIPIAAFLFWYKSYAPPNDLVEDFGGTGWKRIIDIHRYISIIKYLAQSLFGQYLFVTLLIILLIFRQRKNNVRITRAQLAILVSFVGYLSIYITSSYPLDWLISNSIDRLLIHLLPPWLLATGFALWKPGNYSLVYHPSSE